jgi:AAA domain/Protein of unknown function (DUF2726)
MIDLRREAVLVFDKAKGEFVDRTQEIAERRGPGGDGKISIRYQKSRQVYTYGPERIRVVPVRAVAIPPGAKVSVDGEIWPSVIDVWAFDGPEGPLRRIIYRRPGQEGFKTLPVAQIQIITGAEQNPRADGVLKYWRVIASRLPAENPTRRGYATMDFVHPESALGQYLVGAPIRRWERQASPIFPFRCNLSQRQAVDNALSNSISVIEGPPGTGKTETILNLIASIVAAGAGTVGVVSLSNSAVDNVREKLVDLGFGYVIAGLGRQEKRQEFFAAQATRSVEVERFLKEEHPMPPAGRLADVDKRLRAAQAGERTRAEFRLELDAHLLELRHFEDHLVRQDIPDLEGLPLLRRSSERIVDFLAETHFDVTRSRPGLLRRIRRYLRYGSLRGLDPGDTEVVLRLQRAYYDRRITELRAEIMQVESKLQRVHFDRLVAGHQELSGQTLRAALDARYRGLSRTSYRENSYQTGKTFQQFTEDYPVVLSTCHSLRRSIAGGTLLDYLIIDEASQVDLLTAGLALSCCRNLVVVGDRKQLAQIDSGAAEGLTAPGPAYDYQQSILSSLGDLYGDQLPVTLLREHYRCDPAIIGYCNKAFYDGDLIPYTIPGPGRAMIVAPTVAGNHMRQHRGGGRSNQREVDVIVGEVIPKYCADFPPTDIGVTTPYNLQVDKVAAALLDGSEAATVHKFQGRQKPVVIMTTVLDETWRGQTGHKFVDDPKMINVAVSRAARKFILVTNNQLMASSRHLRDLIGYIRYHDPDQGVVDSAVISVFDLLYREYDRRLRPLAARRRQELKYPSEDIIWTVLLDLLAEAKYAHLTVVGQVLLRNLLPDLSGLTPRQAKYVQNRASVDFVVYNRVTNQPWLVIEVDGFKYHEDDPEQLARDELKNQILLGCRMSLLRLPTTGSDEERRIREALDRSEIHWPVSPGARL